MKNLSYHSIHKFLFYAVLTLVFASLAGLYQVQAQDRPFITTWETTEDNETIIISTLGNHYDIEVSDYDFTIDWGDGIVEDISGDDPDPSHTYAEAGNYTVKIVGSFPILEASFLLNASKLQSIEQWGDIEWESMRGAFYGAENMVYNATDSPDLSNVNDMTGMFQHASSFNGDLSNWDVSSVTDMSSMFSGADSFNQDIGSWDVSSVTDMGGMFSDAISFNQDLSSWDVENVTDMSLMFRRASSFNQDLSSWNVSSVTDIRSMFIYASSFNGDLSNWDLSNVTDMRFMFVGASSFNQDLSSWDVSSVTDMVGMFSDAISFNQDLSSWDVSNVVIMNRMFQGATSFNQDLSGWNVIEVRGMMDMLSQTNLSIENFDALLFAWQNLELNNDVNFGVDGLFYCAALEARQKIIDSYNWEITGDELCLPPSSVNLVSPLHNAEGIELYPELKWESKLQINFYEVNISSSTEFISSTGCNCDTRLLKNTTDTILILQSPLMVDTTYYWRVRAENNGGISEWSEIRSFRTTSQIDPIAIDSIDIDINIEPPFSLWLVKDPKPDNVGYNFILSSTPEYSDTLIHKSDYALDSLTVTQSDSLLNGSTYYFKIRKQQISNPENFSEWTESELQVHINTPQLNEPEDGAMQQSNVNLSWAEEQTDHYQFDVQVSDREDFSSLILQETGYDQSTISLQDLQSNEKFYWRVRRSGKVNSEINSKWVTRSFYTRPDYISLQSDSVSAREPSYIDIRLHALDARGRGITTLEDDDFELLENGSQISPTESRYQLSKLDRINSTIKTVLMLDNSTSIGEENLESIKAAARQFVLNKPDDMEVTIFVFADQYSQRIDFTRDTTDLLDTIEDISLTNLPGTDIYSAAIEGLQQWDDRYSLTSIEQGFMLLFTDGRDLAGRRSLDDVLNARGDKQIYAVGVELGSADFDEEALRDIGNAGTYIDANFDNIISRFEQVLDRLESFSNSFYWLNYSSPSRGSSNTLEVSVRGNSNSGTDATIEQNFDASSFYSVPLEIIVNASAENPIGIEALTMSGSDTLEVDIETVFSFNPQPFMFQVSSPEKLAIVPHDSEPFVWNFYGRSAEAAELEVVITDTSQSTLDLQKTLTIDMTEPEGELPFITIDGTQNVSARNGGTVNFETFGASMDIPGDALDEDIDIEMGIYTDVPEGAAVSGNVIHFGPSGTKFKEPVQITVSYDPENFPEGVTTAEELELLRYNNTEETWTVLESTVNTENQTLTGSTTHLSGFGAGKKKTVTSSDEDSSTPYQFALQQNFPNPFNPTTRISYELPDVADVTLIVYDMLGREVMMLVNERKSAGAHSVDLDASNLSSGMYIYRIQAGDYLETRKMTLIK